MCPIDNCVLPIGSLIVIRGQDPSTIIPGPPPVGSIIVFRPYFCNPDFLVVHRVIQVAKWAGGYPFVTKGDANSVSDTWNTECWVDLTMISSSQVVCAYQSTIP